MHMMNWPIEINLAFYCQSSIPAPVSIQVKCHHHGVTVVYKGHEQLIKNGRWGFFHLASVYFFSWPLDWWDCLIKRERKWIFLIFWGLWEALGEIDLYRLEPKMTTGVKTMTKAKTVLKGTESQSCGPRFISIRD